MANSLMVYVIYTTQHPCWIMSVWSTKASAMHEYKKLIAEGHNPDTTHIIEAVLQT